MELSEVGGTAPVKLIAAPTTSHFGHLGFQRCPGVNSHVPSVKVPSYHYTATTKKPGYAGTLCGEGEDRIFILRGIFHLAQREVSNAQKLSVKIMGDGQYLRAQS